MTSVEFLEWCDTNYPLKNKNYLGKRLHSKSKYDDSYTTEDLFKIWAGVCKNNGIKRFGESCTLNNNCSFPYCMVLTTK
jgi:hypothetical protein